MTNDSTNFNLSLDAELDEFDPLEDSEPETEDDAGGEYLAPAGLTPEAIAAAQPAHDDRPAEERMSDLLTSMAPRRKVLLGILSFCHEPQPVAEVNAYVDELQQNNYSVYTAANLCSLLERAGGLERVTADGGPADDIEQEPQVVVVDGVEYLEASEPVELFWVATDAGRGAVEADKPLERLRNLLDEDATYLPIYKRILTLCSAEGGAKTPAINDAVDHDPLVQKPRFYAPHFIDKLEKCDALVWEKTWVATEVGRAGLEMLADVVDETATNAAESADANEKE